MNATRGAAPAGSAEGERVLPGDPAQSLIYEGHLAIHAFGHRRLAANLRVLDIGCGEGYGADLLARRSRLCVALDRDPAVVAAAARKYARPGLAFAVADAGQLPFRPASFDAVWSVEVIEHLRDPAPYLDEVQRVLRSGGLYFLSTPNRPVYSPTGVMNPFHFREYDADELGALLSKRFPRVDIQGLYLTWFLSARRRLLASLLLALQRSGLDRLLPSSALHPLFRRAFRRRVTGEEWNERTRAAHCQPAPLGVVGRDYCLDLVATCRR